MSTGVKVALKIITGIVILPLSFLFAAIWPWWESEDTATWKKVLSGVFIIPMALFLYWVSDWWENLYRI